MTLPFDYPSTRRDEDAVEDFHGVSIPTPYKWLENPHASEVQEWVQSENAITQSFMSQGGIEKNRAEYLKSLQASFTYDKFSSFYRVGDRYFYSKKAGLQNQSVYYKFDNLERRDEEMQVLLDPNTLRADGKSFFSVSLTVRDTRCMWFLFKFIKVSGCRFTGKLISSNISAQPNEMKKEATIHTFG